MCSKGYHGKGGGSLQNRRKGQNICAQDFCLLFVLIQSLVEIGTKGQTMKHGAQACF